MAEIDRIIDKCYIRDIQTHGLRNIGNINIPLVPDEEKFCHLLITGDNGVGKTTFVKELFRTLSNEEGGKPLSMFRYYASQGKFENVTSILSEANWSRYSGSLLNNIKNFKEGSKIVPDCALHPEFYAAFDDRKFLVFNFSAQRREVFLTPEGPKRIGTVTGGKQFVQLLVNLRTQSAFAYQDRNVADVEKIQNWFDRLNNSLAELLGHNDFQLLFDGKNFNFTIKEKGKEPYSFNQLSDGYSAIISIISEIMLQMSIDPVDAYDLPGIVIIDEIETHLHVELQKKILPFLIKLFPRLQFVVTTHSPFVLSSIENAVIYDLGTKERYEDFSRFSYPNIVEGFYDTSNYSNAVKEELGKLECIFEKPVLTEDDKAYIARFDNYIASMPSLQPVELQNRWLTLKLKNIAKLS